MAGQAARVCVGREWVMSMMRLPYRVAVKSFIVFHFIFFFYGKVCIISCVLWDRCVYCTSYLSFLDFLYVFQVHI